MLNEKKNDKNQNVILHFEFTAPAQKWKYADSIPPPPQKSPMINSIAIPCGTYIKLSIDMPPAGYGPITVPPPQI